MLTLLTGNSFAAFGNLAQSSDLLLNHLKEINSDPVGLEPHYVETLTKSLREIERVADALALDATSAAIKNCHNLLSRCSMSEYGPLMARKDVEYLAWQIHHVRANFTAQIESRMVMVIGDENSRFMSSEEPPFGLAVDDAFPRSAEEISEAAKCLALKRNTACVFHLMRAMESAVARLSEAIGTGKAVDKEWGKILSDIGTSIESLPKGSSRDRWSECHSHLYHVKQAWRNDTMHPKKTYTDEQAKAVFIAVRSFMMHLAPLVR